MRSIILVATLFALSCGGANPCVTRGATYIARALQTSGNCGPIPDQVVNVTSSGEIPAGKGIACDSRETDGCTQRNSGCISSANGVTCTMTTSITFAGDGASGTGAMSATCTGTEICAGSYSVTYVRQ